MIDLYTFGTPNGRKVSIMLEEVGLAYRVHVVDIGVGEQFQPEFTAIGPSSKIPVIVDTDGPDGKSLAMFESGAILIYLAEKTQSPLLPTEPRARYGVIQWLMFQMGGVGPMFGQANHFLKFAKEDVPYGKQRYTAETRRLYGIMDRRLADHPYLAGGEYSIADIACFPWVARFDYHKVDLNDFPRVKSWFDALSQRPAMQKGMAVPEQEKTGMRLLEDESVVKVRQALNDIGLSDRVIELEVSAADTEKAAMAIGTETGAVVKSMIFLIGEQPVLVLVAGDLRCKEDALPRALNLTGEVRKADAEEVLAATGFVIGGVAPVALALELPTAIDVGLKRFETLYAAAGHPQCVFPITVAELKKLTGGIVSYNIAEPA